LSTSSRSTCAEALSFLGGDLLLQLVLDADALVVAGEGDSPKSAVSSSILTEILSSSPLFRLDHRVVDSRSRSRVVVEGRQAPTSVRAVPIQLAGAEEKERNHASSST
jgi:hypothetical protein